MRAADTVFVPSLNFTSTCPGTTGSTDADALAFWGMSVWFDGAAGVSEQAASAATARTPTAELRMRYIDSPGADRWVSGNGAALMHGAERASLRGGRSFD